MSALQFIAQKFEMKVQHPKELTWASRLTKKFALNSETLPVEQELLTSNYQSRR